MKRGREKKKKKKKGERKKNNEILSRSRGRGVVSLILKGISYNFKGVDTWFLSKKRKKKKYGG